MQIVRKPSAQGRNCEDTRKPQKLWWPPDRVTPVKMALCKQYASLSVYACLSVCVLLLTSSPVSAWRCTLDLLGTSSPTLANQSMAYGQAGMNCTPDTFFESRSKLILQADRSLLMWQSSFQGTRPDTRGLCMQAKMPYTYDHSKQLLQSAQPCVNPCRWPTRLLHA